MVLELFFIAGFGGLAWVRCGGKGRTGFGSSCWFKGSGLGGSALSAVSVQVLSV